MRNGCDQALPITLSPNKMLNYGGLTLTTNNVMVDDARMNTNELHFTGYRTESNKNGVVEES